MPAGWSNLRSGKEAFAVRRSKEAFTLIELLIVVAIIAILALIAVPNFLEAQTRAKISRCKADMRSLATAIEAYQVDNNVPPYTEGSIDDPRGLIRLSTPISYITNPLLKDPFKLYPPGANDRWSSPDPSLYLNYVYIPFRKEGTDWAHNVDDKFRRSPAFPRVEGHDLGYGPPADPSKFPGPFRWSLTGYGPDRSLQFDNAWEGNPGGLDAYLPYDPTNGTVSMGDVYRFG
jgi:prepilin-type N-terminal cleavage/methylation domain-containing protein